MEIKNTIEIDVKDFVNKYNKFSTTTAKRFLLIVAMTKMVILKLILVKNI